jgi:RNA polymerase sigma factor (sigma-70 family)
MLDTFNATGAPKSRRDQGISHRGLQKFLPPAVVIVSTSEQQMIDFSQTTTTQLLDRLLNTADDEVWSAFDLRYRSILMGLGRRMGLSADEAEDLAQQTLTEFVRDYQAGRYSRERGKLRAWLISIARHRATDLLRSRRSGQLATEALSGLPDEHELTQAWAEEHERVIFAFAMEQLRAETRTSPQTLQIFEQVGLRGVAPAAAAAETGVEIAEIYRIKHRITKALREIVNRIEQSYED